VDQNLHSLFEQALDDEPQSPPGDTVREAVARGRRIRRRRGLLIGGSVTAAAAAIVLTLNLLPADSAPPETVSVASMVLAPARPACTWPAQQDVSDVSIFLTPTVTPEQEQELNRALQADGQVRGLRFESRQMAYERFRELWKDSPDFVQSVSPESLPASFRLALADPDGFPAFAERYRHVLGVQDIVGRDCPGATE
jgi:cell division transport system permease protein